MKEKHTSVAEAIFCLLFAAFAVCAMAFAIITATEHGTFGEADYTEYISAEARVNSGIINYYGENDYTVTIYCITEEYVLTNVSVTYTLHSDYADLGAEIRTANIAELEYGSPYKAEFTAEFHAPFDEIFEMMDIDIDILSVSGEYASAKAR